MEHHLESIEEKFWSVVESSGIEKKDLRFVYVFGSYTEDPESASDVDICVSVDVEESSEAEFKLRGRSPDEFDISVFERLPLQVKKEVFKGELLYSRDKCVYDSAFDVFKDYEQFEPLYKTCIGA